MQERNLIIKLDRGNIGGVRATTRELRRIATAINLSERYGFTMDDWKDRTIVCERSGVKLGKIDVS